WLAKGSRRTGRAEIEKFCDALLPIEQLPRWHRHTVIFLRCSLNAAAIRKILQEVRRGKVSPDEGVARLRHLPFEDLGFAKVDHHRALRAGMPEVILGQGKTPSQVAAIFFRLAKHGGNILATRSSPQQFAAVKKKIRACQYHELSHTIVLERD